MDKDARGPREYVRREYVRSYRRNSTGRAGFPAGTLVARVGAGALTLLLLIFMLALGIRAQADSRENLEKPATGLRALVASGRLEDLRWPNFPDYRAQVENLYRRSGYATVWIRKGQPTPQALEMISILRQADSKGLLAAIPRRMRLAST